MKIFDFQVPEHKEFNPLFSQVRLFGKTCCIENHYHSAKVFKLDEGSAFFPEDWKKSKKLAEAGTQQIAWKIGGFILPIRINRIGYQIHDFGVQLYLLLWQEYFKQNPSKLKYIQQFYRFQNPFKLPANFSLRQTDIFFKIKQDGLNSLRFMITELGNLLDGEIIIEYDLLKIKYGVICCQVNKQGMINTGLTQQIFARYPIVYQKYLEFLPHAKLGDILVVNVDKCLTIFNLFTQYQIGSGHERTDKQALENCLLKIPKLQDNKPIYLPDQLGCNLGEADWKKFRTLIKSLNRAIICHK